MHGQVRQRATHAPPRMRAPSAVARPRRFYRRQAVLVTVWSRLHYRPWLPEDAARTLRRRSLLQDNPTSG
jgi:hypothetical protein